MRIDEIRISILDRDYGGQDVKIIIYDDQQIVHTDTQYMRFDDLKCSFEVMWEYMGKAIEKRLQKVEADARQSS